MTEDEARRGDLWARPLFRVEDLERSLRYYRERLGFATDWIDRTTPWPVCAQVGRAGATIILDQDAYFPKASRPSVLSLEVNDTPGDPMLNALHHEFLAKGANVRSPPTKVLWDDQVYEMSVEDPDGNLLLFWGNSAAVNSK